MEESKWEILKKKQAENIAKLAEKHPDDWFYSSEMNKPIEDRTGFALADGICYCCGRLEITLRTDKKYNVFAVKNDFMFSNFDECPGGYNNLVDACVEIILKLHESW